MAESISVIEILILIALFIGSAFFSSSETALLSVNRFKIEKLAKEGNKNAQLVLKLLENPQKLITTILIGNNLVNIAAASISTGIAIKLFGDVGIGIATGIVTLLTIIFGEVLPKNFALRYSEKLALSFARILYILEIIFSPLSWILIKITEKLFPNNEENKLTEEELKIILEHSKKHGAIDEEEKELIENVLELDKTIVKEVMTPRTEIVAIDESKNLNEILEIMKKTSYSKIPVYKENIDNIIGVVYLKDVLKNLDKKELKVKDIARKPYFVPETKKLDDLFKKMKEKKVKMAIVIDEYGGTAGLITLEDILEYLVGEINDKKQDIIKINDKTYVVDGNTNLIELEREIEKEFDTEANTVSGLIMEKLDRLPKKGDKIKIDNVVFEVLETNGNKIKKVIVKLL
ncbi:MAG: hemolysin family protein [Nanoarchaeota archaeon]